MTHAGVKALTSELAQRGLAAHTGKMWDWKQARHGTSSDVMQGYCTVYQPAPATGAGYKKEEVLQICHRAEKTQLHFIVCYRIAGLKYLTMPLLGKKFQHSTGQHNHTWLTTPLLKQEKFKNT